MTSLVTPGTAFDPYELASADVRSYCGQQFDYVADDVVTIDPRPNRTAQLPQMPVTAISSVQAYMPDGNGSWGWQTLTYPGQYGWTERGLMWDATRISPAIVPSQAPAWPFYTWPWLPGSLKVTYTHGYQEIPVEIQQITARLAAAYAANPSMLQSKKVGEVSRVYGAAGVEILRPEERKILDRYTVIEV